MMDFVTLRKLSNDPNWKFYIPEEDFEKVRVKCTINGLKRQNGHFLPNLCRNVSVIKHMDVRPDDTFIITYPKSGTHWVAELCWLIQHNCDFERAKNEVHSIRSVFIDMGLSNDLLNLESSPRVFQTHMRRCFLPDNIEKRAKLVYVVRNPKDVIVSFYFFIRNLPDDQFDGTMKDFFDRFVSGEIMYGPWCDHVNEFTKLANIHLIHFEDLLEDGINETRKLAKFLGKDLSDDRLEEIVDFCSFENLKRNNVFEFNSPNRGDNLDEVKILRKGQIGDWRNDFTEEMSKTIDHIVATKLEYKKMFRFEPNVKIGDRQT